MLRNIAFIVLALAACSKDKPSTTASPGGGVAASGGGDNPDVDPTLPSWAPPSCVQYHKLTIQLGECTAMAQGDRDAITQQYQTRLAEWKALENAEQGQLDAVKQQCEAAVTELSAKKSTSCPAATESVTRGS